MQGLEGTFWQEQCANKVWGGGAGVSGVSDRITEASNILANWHKWVLA